MKKHNRLESTNTAQAGSLNVLLLPLILAVLLLFGAIGFGYWAFSGRQDYKNNVDKKVATAVAAAKTQESASRDAYWQEQNKLPLTTYNGPEQYGSLVVKYPKTWSAYVDSTGNGSNGGLDAYFQPGVVPSISDQNSTFALRVQVVNQSYSSVIAQFNGQPGVTVSPYSLPLVPKAIGVKVSGQIESNKTGTMIILPMRTMTLEIYTESSQYQNDFNNNILPNFSFLP